MKQFIRRLKAELKVFRSHLQQGEFYPCDSPSFCLNDIHENPEAKTLFILVHSWLGAKQEMSPLALHLNKLGFSSINVMLRGHGTRSEDLLNYDMSDWLNQLESVLNQYESNYENIVLVGQCGGGNVILNALQKNLKHVKIKAIILASVPSIYRSCEVTSFAYLYNLFHRIVLKPISNFVHPFKINKQLFFYDFEFNPAVPHYGYKEKYPVFSIGEGGELLRKTANSKLYKINVPALIFHYKDDYYYKQDHAQKLYRQINCVNPQHQNQLILLDNQQTGPIGSHLIFTNSEVQQDVFEKIDEFIASLNIH